MKRLVKVGRRILIMGITTRQVGKLSVKVVTQDNTLERKNLISRNDQEMDDRAIAAVKSALYKAKICKKPIAKYDPILKKAYVE